MEPDGLMMVRGCGFDNMLPGTADLKLCHFPALYLYLWHILFYLPIYLLS